MKLFQVTEGNMQQSDWAIKKIPVIIRMMQDDEAVVTMVDFNLQREQITPSEKAYAYKMKYDAIKKKAGRKNCVYAGLSDSEAKCGILLCCTTELGHRGRYEKRKRQQQR